MKLSAITIASLVMLLSPVSSEQYLSHVSVSTPGGSYSHGVGRPVGHTLKRTPKGRAYPGHGRRYQAPSLNNLNREGYPRFKPSIPFTDEEVHGKYRPPSPWQGNRYETDIPVLPPSPYKVDSPDPESLWPEGLFLPPLRPAHFLHRRLGVMDTGKSSDPFLLEGSEAIAAVQKSKDHGELFFDHIPHIESLLFNQEVREKNNLEPHRVGSIRHTWPYNRP